MRAWAGRVLVEWRGRLPHLPAIVLLGDCHTMKPPCPGFDDLTDAKTKEVGGTQSFWHYLDTDPTLSAYARRGAGTVDAEE